MAVSTVRPVIVWGKWEVTTAGRARAPRSALRAAVAGMAGTRAASPAASSTTGTAAGRHQ